MSGHLLTDEGAALLQELLAERGQEHHELRIAVMSAFDVGFSAKVPGVLASCPCGWIRVTHHDHVQIETLYRGHLGEA